MARYVQLAPSTKHTQYHCICCFPSKKTTVTANSHMINIHVESTNLCGCETHEEKVALRVDQVTAMRTQVGCFDPTPCQILSCLGWHADCLPVWLNINASGIEYFARMSAREAAAIQERWVAPSQQEMR